MAHPDQARDLDTYNDFEDKSGESFICGGDTWIYEMDYHPFSPFTVVYDPEGFEFFSIPGVYTKDQLAAIVGACHHHRRLGYNAGRAMMAHDIRELLGEAEK